MQFIDNNKHNSLKINDLSKNLCARVKGALPGRSDKWREGNAPMLGTLTPSSNTGVKLTSTLAENPITTSLIDSYINIHWFQGSFLSHKIDFVLDQVSAFVYQLFSESIEWEVKGGVNGYQSSYNWRGLISVNYDLQSDFGAKFHNSKAMIVFRGGFFDAIGFENVLAFSKLVQRCWVVVTRFDAYYQDVDRVVEIADIFKAYQDGCCRGFRSYNAIFSSSGDSFNLGRRGKNGSGKYLRIYDKEQESKGEISGIRWEVEFSGYRAVSAWDLLRGGEFQPKYVCGMIFAVCDWIRPTNDKHRSRWERLPWFQVLIDNTDLVRVAVPKRKTDIDKKVAWLTNSVSGTLAYLRAYLRFVSDGDDGFDDVLSEIVNYGREKLGKGQLLRLQADVAAFISDSCCDIPIPSVADLKRVI